MNPNLKRFHRLLLLGLLILVAPRGLASADYYGGGSVRNLQAGIADLKAGRIDPALQNLSQAVKENPNLPEGWFYLGVCHEARRMPAEAARCFEQVLSRNPRHASTLLRYARILLNQDSTREQGLTHAIHAYKAQPGSVEALEVLAQGYFRNQRLEEAEKWYLELLRRAPQARGAYFALGMVALTRGDGSKAVACFHRDLEIFPNARAHLALADLYEKNEDFSRALHHYQNALNLAEGKEPALAALLKKKLRALSKKSQSRLFSNLSQNLKTRDNPWGAATTPNALVQAPTLAQPPARKKYNLAPRTFDTGIDFAGEYRGKYENLSDQQPSFQNHGNRVPGGGHSRLDSSQLEYHLNLANGYLRQNLLAEATKHVTVILNSGDSSYYSEQAQKLKGLIDQKQRFRKEEYAATHLKLGLDFLAREKLKEAENEFLKARELKPNEPELYKNLAILELKKGNHAAAADHLKKSLLLKPNLADSHILMAMLLKSEGRTAEALEFTRKARSLTSDNTRLEYLADLARKMGSEKNSQAAGYAEID